ncbi:uncharacterized protein LOC110112123 [Dendrobium catenatum]|uniref:uncharacterized protein LOC110112123 n=1 Tax=Dendrobium catenatum TaxID=906689 RepID=UPI0009F46979|nr:uncharacterized protein LOC110112123 [Dendrobium catenatum]
MAVNRHVARVASDHCPVVMQVEFQNFKHPKIMRFKDVWLSYPVAYHVVKKASSKKFVGDPMEVLNKKFRFVLRTLFFWNWSKHNSLLELKDKLKVEVDELQNKEANGSGLSDQSILLLKTKVHELNITFTRLNIWWRQRIKVKWIKEGDINSQFFHSFANGRKNGNSIR